MKGNQFAITLAIALALAALTASSAFGAATTEVRPWRTGTTEGGTTVLSGSQTITAKATEKLVTKTTIAGTPLEFESSEIACQSCTIFNEGGGAKGKGKLEIKNISFITPKTCKIKENKIVTNEVSIDATYMIGAAAYMRLVPLTGESFWTATIEKNGGACPIAGSYVKKGVLFGKLVNATGTFKSSQQINFSPAINAEAGGELRFGAEPAFLTGAATFEAGGKFFGVEK